LEPEKEDSKNGGLFFYLNAVKKERGIGCAQGDVLTFLDAHCECTQGWLEPLLGNKANPQLTMQ
jgi:hypothetical protein